MDIALCGGPATGKDTLKQYLHEAADEKGLPHQIIYMSTYAVRIPMRLEDTGIKMPEQKDKFIDMVVREGVLSGIVEKRFPRREMDKYRARLEEKFGETYLGELALALRDSHKINIYNNIPGEPNLALLRQNNVYVVKMTCSLDTQVERIMDRKKNIDPSTEEEVREQVASSNSSFGIHEFRSVDLYVNTDRIPEGRLQQVADKLLRQAMRRPLQGATFTYSRESSA